MTKRKNPSRLDLKSLLRDQIQKLHSEGLNDSEIGEIVCRNHRTVAYYRNALELPANKQHLIYETEEDRMKGYMIRNIKGSSARRGIEFKMTYRDIPSLPEFCPILPSIRLKYRGSGTFNENSRATIDRIDSKKGYIPGNVWVISRLANTMKNEASIDQLEEFAKNILVVVENQRALGSITDSESLDS